LHNVPADLSSVSAAIRMRGYEPLVAQLTTPDLRELGLHVVRVLIPGLQPLHGNHAWPHLGGARLKRLSSVFGGKVALGASINPFPHPFA
jgi:ribosomal protein S12 methylthiotransferase accessory factor